MKFCENLQKLRKRKGISQEQLAELLGVTRQSVSKWESGASYPEMEKITEMCKIFNISLDILVNGDVDEVNTTSQSNPFNQILDIIKSAIGKTITMLENMDPNQIVKFILTLILIGVIIAFCRLPFSLLEHSIDNMILNTTTRGNYVFELFSNIWAFLINIAYLLFAFVTFFYIYKVKYLDRIEIVKENVKVETDTVKNVTIKKEKVQVKENPYYYQKTTFFDFLGKIIIGFVKFMIGLIGIWACFVFVPVVIAFALLMVVATQGLFLTGPILMALASIIFIITIINVIFNFIFNKNTSGKKSAFSILFSLILGAVGVALTIWYFLNLTYIDGPPPSYKAKESSKEIMMNNELTPGHLYNLTYEVDNNLTDKVVVTAKYYYDNYNSEFILDDNKYINFSESYSNNQKFTPKKFIKDAINNFKDEKVYNYNELFRINYVIKTSEANINILKENRNKNDNYHYNYDYDYDHDNDYDYDDRY